MTLRTKSDATSAGKRAEIYECALTHDEVGGDEDDHVGNADDSVNGLAAVQPRWND